MKLKGKSFNMTMIMVYASTGKSTKEEIDKFYESFENTKSQSNSKKL